MRMSNDVALVTGASSGIGFELARCFAADGHRLIINAEDGPGLRNAAEILREDGAPDVRYLVRDLSHPDAAMHLYRDIRQMEVVPDYVVNNAGIGVFGDFAQQTDFQSEIAMIQLNVISVVHLTKLFARDMIKRGSGRILITSSVAALAPSPNLAVYSGTKAFGYAFAEAIANELKGTGVTVTALMPDATETRFFERAGMMNTQLGRSEKANAAEVAAAGYKAMMKGTDHVLAPLKANIHAAMAAIFPKRIVTGMAKAE